VIKITKLNNESVYVNPDLVEFVEASPDTALLMRGGKRVVVRDSVDAVLERILEYKKNIFSSVNIKK